MRTKLKTKLRETGNGWTASALAAGLITRLAKSPTYIPPNDVGPKA